MAGFEKPLIAQKLYAGRKHLGLNAHAVADDSGGLFKFRTLQSWECGHRPFPEGNKKVMDYICRLYGISPNYLTDDTKDVNDPDRFIKPGEVRTDAVREIPFFSSFPIGREKAHYTFPIWGRNGGRKAFYARMGFEDLVKEGDVLLIDDSVDTFTTGDLVLIWRKNVLDIARYDPTEEQVEVVARITGVFKDFDVCKTSGSR